MKSTRSASRPRSARKRKLLAKSRAKSRLTASETLESRVLLAGDTGAWHNADMPMDTNVDGHVTALDALVAINDLNQFGARDVEIAAASRGMVDVDANGVVTPADPLRIINFLNQAAGEDHFEVQIRLVATATDSEDPLNSLGPNQEFLLRAYTSDVTDVPTGIFAAYLDVNYTAALADAVGPFEFSSSFANGRQGNLAVDGELDEVGAFGSLGQGSGADELLLFSLPMRTENMAGTLTFSGSAADTSPQTDVLRFGRETPVPADEIEFLGASVQITAEAITAMGDTFEAREDQPLVVFTEQGVLNNDVNPDGVDITAVKLTDPSNGSVTLNEDGSFTYVPGRNFFGSDSFTYAVHNGQANSNAATVTINVAGVNDPPSATGESYAVDGSTASMPSVLDVSDPAEGLLANDTDIDSSELTVNVVEQPSGGSLNLGEGGRFTYAPTVGFSGTDSFQYTVSDGEFTTAPVTATIDVLAVGVPTAHPETYLAVRNHEVLVAPTSGVLVNDVDPDGDSLTALLVEDVSHGNLTLNENGSLTYTPDDDFLGDDSFTYSAFDGTSASDPVTVTITVQAAGGGNAPIAENDAYETRENTTLVIDAPGILANDRDEDGHNVVANLLIQPNNGTLTLNPDGSFSYTPNEGFTGQDLFGYTTTDGLLRSNAGAVQIVVIEVVDSPPTANDESYAVEFQTTLTVNAENGVLANDSDPDGDPITAALFEGQVPLPAHGTLDLAADGSFVYTPDDGFSGEDSFQYVVQSGDLSSTEVATATLVVAPPDELLSVRLATTNSAGETLDTVTVGDTFYLNVYVEDLSPEPRQGVFSAYTDVTWNGELASVSGALEFSALYPNGQRGDASTSGLLDEAGAFDGTEFLGPDEQLLFRVPMEATESGTVTFVSDPADAPNSDVLLFALNDELVPEQIVFGSTALTIEMEYLPPPTAVDDAYVAPAGRATVNAENGVLANDSGSGGALTAELATGPANGNVQLAEDGSFTYVANEGYVGDDSFTYLAVEDGVQSEPATVRITVSDAEPTVVVGSMYFDTNNNGVREEHELPFGGVELLLTGTDVEGQVVSHSTFTDRDGQYAFPEVLPGEYVVTQIQPDIVIDGIDTWGGEVSAESDRFHFTLEAGDAIGEFNFGERGLHPTFFANPFYFSSRQPEGVSFGLRADGSQSWYSFDEGWDGFQSASAELSADGAFVTVTAVDLSGRASTATLLVRIAGGVLVTGNAEAGHYIKLTGPASQFGLTPVIDTAAVDAAFAD